MNKWYRIEAKADKAEVWLYDYIGEDFWTGGGITAKNFQKELGDIKASQIDLHINSPGGEVFDGIAIYNLLKQHPATVTTYIDGLAASIASVIALAGDKIFMAENATFMIHNPRGMAIGEASDMRKTADVLDKIRGSMTKAYMEKSGKPEEEINALLDAESWMDADEAMAAGFVDEITEKMDLAACAKFIPAMAKMGFRHIPQSINGMKEKPSERELERVLRDAGCTKKEAKAILAEGYRGDRRDDDATDAPPAEPTRRDVEPAEAAGKDHVADLLIQAARMTAPST